MALGGIFGSLLGGYALTNLQIDTIFVLFTVLPGIQLFSCGLVEENSVGSNSWTDFSGSNISHEVNGKRNDSHEDDFLAKKSNISVSRRKSQKNSKRGEVSSGKSQIPEKANSLALQWFRSLKGALYSLFNAFRQPIILRWLLTDFFYSINRFLGQVSLSMGFLWVISPLRWSWYDQIIVNDLSRKKKNQWWIILNSLPNKVLSYFLRSAFCIGSFGEVHFPFISILIICCIYYHYHFIVFAFVCTSNQGSLWFCFRPMAWFFLAHVTIPNLSTVMFYYQTEFLNLEASFLGTSRVVGWLGLMFGTFIYNKYLKKMKLRRILM